MKILIENIEVQDIKNDTTNDQNSKFNCNFWNIESPVNNSSALNLGYGKTAFIEIFCIT